MKEYKDLFTEAVNRTRDYKLPTPHIEDHKNGKKYLTDAVSDKFHELIKSAVGDLWIEDIAAQCHTINARLKPILENFFGCSIYYTIGWATVSKEIDICKFEEGYIEKVINGTSGSKLNLHVWLTLPSWEIIDISLATSLAFSSGNQRLIGITIANDADTLKEIKFFPYIIGEEALRKGGYLSDPPVII